MGVWESNANVTAWHSIDIGANGLHPHTDGQVFAFDPQGNVYYGNDGGLYRYVPVAARGNQLPGLGNWTSLNTTGVQTTLDNSIALSAGPNLVLSGSQDNGVARTTGAAGGNSLDSQQVLGGDGGEVRFAPGNPLIAYALEIYGHLYRSSDAGKTWSYVGQVPSDDEKFYPFYSVFAVDPTNPNHVAIGSKSQVYETENGGATWNETLSLLPVVAGSEITALTFAPSEDGGFGDVIYVGYNTGQVFVTQDDGIAWMPVDNPPWAGSRVSSIIADPDLPGTAYLAVSAFDTDQVYVTEDFGQTWTSAVDPRAVTDLPNLPVNSLAVNQENGLTVLYAGTDVGVYRGVETAVGWVWEAFGDGLPFVKVTDEQILQTGGKEYLYVSTYGRGNWRVQIPVTPLAMTTTPGGTVFLGSGTNLTDSATLSGGNNPTGTIAFALDDPNGNLVYTDVVTVNGDGTYTTDSGTNPGGYSPIVTGTYQWIVTYSGDSNNASLTSSEPEDVLSNGITTFTTISSSVFQSVTGQPVTFTATVAPSSGMRIPTGSVEFFTFFPNTGIVPQVLGTATLDGAGQTQLTVNNLLPGQYGINAVYSGDSYFLPSSSLNAAVLQVFTAPTALTISAATTTVTAGQSTTLSSFLSVLPPGAFVVPPTGTVTFYASGAAVVQLFQLPVNESISWIFSGAGIYTIFGIYSGDSNYLYSESPAITLTVVSAGSSPAVDPPYSLSSAVGPLDNNGEALDTAFASYYLALTKHQPV